MTWARGCKTTKQTGSMPLGTSDLMPNASVGEPKGEASVKFHSRHWSAGESPAALINSPAPVLADPITIAWYAVCGEARESTPDTHAQCASSWTLVAGIQFDGSTKLRRAAILGLASHKPCKVRVLALLPSFNLSAWRNVYSVQLAERRCSVRAGDMQVSPAALNLRPVVGLKVRSFRAKQRGAGVSCRGVCPSQNIGARQWQWHLSCATIKDHSHVSRLTLSLKATNATHS